MADEGEETTSGPLDPNSVGRIHDNQTELCAVEQRPTDPTNQRIYIEAVRVLTLNR